ncbi:MAG: hypothetical protein HYR58_05725, partial [Acidobacteria bacterium]|nr:hypothetical protein [Acidobacteriota bacterium]
MGAQTIASSGAGSGLPASGGSPAPAEKKATVPQGGTPATGDPQQKQEAPPPQVSGAAPRPVESNVEPGQTNLEIRYDVQGVSVQGNPDRSFLHACTRSQ